MLYSRESLDDAIRELFPFVFRCRLTPFEYMEKVAVKCFLDPSLAETEAAKVIRTAMLDKINDGRYYFIKHSELEALRKIDEVREIYTGTRSCVETS